MRQSTAELWLMAWGEIIRDREGCTIYRRSGKPDKDGKYQFERIEVDGGGLGQGVGEGGRYRPETDPHPSSWVVAQIERVLAHMGDSEKRVAEVVYLEQRGLRTLSTELGSHWQARNARKRLLEAVNDAVVRMRERTIAEAQAQQLLDSGVFDSEVWDQIVAFFLDKEGIRYKIFCTACLACAGIFRLF